MDDIEAPPPYEDVAAHPERYPLHGDQQDIEPPPSYEDVVAHPDQYPLHGDHGRPRADTDYVNPERRERAGADADLYPPEGFSVEEEHGRLRANTEYANAPEEAEE